MKTILAFLALLLAVSATLSSAQTIVEVIAQQHLYSQVNQSLSGKNITIFLNNTGVVATFFPPVNQQPPQNYTDAELSYYVLNGASLNVSVLGDGQLLTSFLPLASLNGGYQRIRVSVVSSNTSKEYFLGPNKVTLNTTALAASNGIIYGVSAPIGLPGAIDSIVQSTAGLSTLNTLLGLAGITLNNSYAGVTVFAPSNSSFAALPSLISSYLSSSAGRTDLQSVLNLHIARGIYYANPAPDGTVTLNSTETLTVTKTASGVTVNNASVVTADVLASNGVVQVINSVLLPSSFQFNLRKALLGLNLTAFESALATFNLTNYLGTNYTLFAPTNAALAGKTPTADLLRYHVAQGSVTDLASISLLQSQLALPSNNSAFQQLTVTTNSADNTTSVNGVVLPAPQSVPGVGVIYVIDTVLTPPSNNIIATIQDAGSFTSLLKAVSYSGLADFLANTTVFAPVDNAFTGPFASYLLLNTTESNADLELVLELHVANFHNYYYIDGVPSLPTTISTLNPLTSITASAVNGTVTLSVPGGSATVVTPNVLASNGVVHAINNILIPGDVEITSDKIVQGFKATAFLHMLAEANMSALLTENDAYTVFVFTDTAYDMAPASLRDDPGTWANVLETHILNDTLTELIPNTTHVMLSGETLFVVSNNTLEILGKESAGQPKVIAGPVRTSNGVVYLINGILSIEAQPSDSGLSSTIIGFIVIGCIVGVLLIIGAAGGGYWYYRKRAGYEKIGDSAF